MMTMMKMMTTTTTRLQLLQWRGQYGDDNDENDNNKNGADDDNNDDEAPRRQQNCRHRATSSFLRRYEEAEAFHSPLSIHKMLCDREKTLRWLEKGKLYCRGW